MASVSKGARVTPISGRQTEEDTHGMVTTVPVNWSGCSNNQANSFGELATAAGPQVKGPCEEVKVRRTLVPE